MNQDRETQQLILQIYDAVLDPGRLPDSLDRITDLLGAQGSIIFDWDRNENYDKPKLIAAAHSSSYPGEGIDKYIEKCGAMEMQDQEQIRAATSRHDTIELIDDAVFAGTPEELKQLPHVQALQRIGVFHRAAGVLNKDNPWIALFTIQFPVSTPPIKDGQREMVEPVLPHLAKALSLIKPSQQLENENESLLAAMNRLTIGVCVIDPQGRRVTHNEEFRRQLETHRVFSFTESGVLRFTRAEEEARFHDLKTHAYNHGRFGARPRKEAISVSAESFLCVEVAPFDKCDEMGSKSFAGYILFSTDASMPVQCNTTALKRAYGLTDTELELANAIAEGLTNAQIADIRERSIATVNTQVKSILAKTQSSTRTQFVRMMMSFGVNFVVNNQRSA